MNGVFSQLVDMGIQHATEEMARAGLPYHNELYVREAVECAKRLASAIDLCGRKAGCLSLAVAFQGIGIAKLWYPISIDRKKMRGYDRASEETSADYLHLWLGRNSGEIPSEAGSLMREAILATAPEEGLCSGMPMPPRLQPHSHPLTYCAVFAIWANVGVGGEAFAARQNRYFRERNMDISTNLQTILDRNDLSKDQQRRYLDRMISWDLSRPAYVQHIRTYFEKQLLKLPYRVRVAIKSCFNFDNTLETVVQQAIRRRSMDFWSFAEDMGYPCPKRQMSFAS